MRTVLRLLALAFAGILFGGGCALLGFGADEAVQGLRTEAEAAAEEREWARAYDALRTLRLEYPENPGTAEAFPLAANLYIRLYFQSRYEAPESRWLATEPEFLFHWLESFYAGGRSDAQEAIEALLVGLPLSFSQRFVAWAADRPALRDLDFRVTEDNGLVQSVRVEPPDPQEASTKTAPR